MEIDTLNQMNQTLATSRWHAFHDKLRADMIEAQCCLESGRLMRASEIIDGILREAKRAGKHLAGGQLLGNPGAASSRQFRRKQGISR